MKRFLIVLLLFPGILYAESKTTWTNIVKYGVDPSGITKCTSIINHVIDSLAKSGGGTLFFPAGTFLTGPIILKSNITLYLDAGSVIKFSDDFDDYLPMVQSRWEDVRLKNFISPVYAFQCENISIRGDGHLDGNGKKWWDFMGSVISGQQVESKWQTIFKNENSELLKVNSYIKSKKNFLRPPMITTYNCKNVLIEGVSISNPPFWTIMPAFSENITITGVTIENPDDSPNTDGIDPSSCKNVHISDCHISVGDDCIVIKSGRDEDGREANFPTENITITNCTMLRGHGGVVIGSEMSGGVRRVTISNCIFQGTDIGIRIKTMRGRGGVVEDIRVSNIAMYDMVNEGILITLKYQPTQPEILSERTPSVHNVHLSNISIRGAQRPIALYGLEEMEISQISFSDFDVVTTRGIIVENSNSISFHDMRMEIKEGIPFEAKDSKNINWDLISVKVPLKDHSYLKFTNCSGIRITNCYQPENISLFTDLDDRSNNICFANNILPGTLNLFNNKLKSIISQNNILSQKN